MLPKSAVSTDLLLLGGMDAFQDLVVSEYENEKCDFIILFVLTFFEWAGAFAPEPTKVEEAL